MPFKPVDKSSPKWAEKRCTNPEHNPPTMIVLPPGSHVWVCPACGHEQTVYVPDVRWGTRSQVDHPVDICGFCAEPYRDHPNGRCEGFVDRRD